MPDEQKTINPFEFNRGQCEPQVNPEFMVLKNIKNTESVYSRILGLLEDSGIPDGYDIEQITHPWDLYAMLQYRQDWTPVAYGLGDLLHTLSLLPNEETVLEIKTWETDTRMEERGTDIEERNLSDNKGSTSISSEVSNSSETKKKMYVDGKASYSGFGFSASVSAGWSKDTAKAHANIAKQTRERTEQSTSETRSTHKVKIALSRETGSESKSTRRIKNINQAYTLNVNFFEVLREYDVTLNLIEVSPVLLGDPVMLNQPAVLYDRAKGSAEEVYSLSGWKDAGGELVFDTKKLLNWGHILNGMRSVEWIAQFTDVYGFSPALVLYRAWSRNLYIGALAPEPRVPTVNECIAFQQQMLKFVRPTSGWAECDESGQLRWAFEIVPGQEKEALEYLYKFVPLQFIAIQQFLFAKGQNDYQATINAAKFFTGQSVTELADKIDKIMIPGPFQYQTVKNFYDEKLPEWVRTILDDLKKSRDKIGPVEIDGSTVQKILLPTNGVHADLSLGLCSGAEDYYEIQRQFDLEEKRLEIEKLKLEVEKLKLDNQATSQGQPDLHIKNTGGKTSLKVNVDSKEDDIKSIVIEE